MKTTNRALWAPGLVIAAAALALAGCGTPGTSGPGTQTTAQEASASATNTAPAPTATSESAAAAPAGIQIKGFKYLGTETVSAGAEIIVTNEDIEAHTITADTGTSFDVNIQAGTSTFTAPTEPGTYPYHCNFHGNMKGTLTVK